jgi:hypothetical protein
MAIHNAAIYLLSSRTKLLNKCLSDLYKNWNYQYEYPVYVHYFGDIYSEKFIEEINKNISNKIYFFNIKKELPANLDIKDLFYNKKNLRYVKESFPKSRLDYLHMCKFASNLNSFGKTGCPNIALKKFDYLMKIDDDSGFLKKIDFDLFDILNQYPSASGYTWSTFEYAHKETRVGLWEFYKSYLKKFGYFPKNHFLKNAILKDDENLMHKINWSSGNLNIFNIKKIIQKPWNEYQLFVNESNGIYKNRWGDIEITSLFLYTHFENPIFDFDLRNKELYTNKIESTFSVRAPSTNMNLSMHNFFPLTIYHYLKFFIKNGLNFLKKKKLNKFKD